MKKYLLLILLITLFTITSCNAEFSSQEHKVDNKDKIYQTYNFKTFGKNQSFSKSKKILLKKIYKNHHTTFYCNAPFSVIKLNGREKAVVEPVQKLFKYRKQKKRASRIEWEHVCQLNSLVNL